MAPSLLPPGVFFGKTLHNWSIAGLRLTESYYAPGLVIPVHVHEQPYFCLILDGSFTEKVDGRTRTGMHSTLLYHPPQEKHSDTFHRAGGRCLSIELDKLWLDRVGRQLTILYGTTEFRGVRLASLSVKLCHELRLMDSVSALAIEGLMLEILAEACRWQRPGAARATPKWAERVREWLLRPLRFLSKKRKDIGRRPTLLSSKSIKPVRRSAWYTAPRTALGKLV